ncbi:DgyrCDS931 [Dimorphilus gyrociliatus]|uniref:DgyrCDS931 n=1 Tax=Dimorphilus gyrociliatus TaxID=2664684 RepID=A0A7I8V7A3_9ANNE|nr:DgyrCDS931 [Dimorphilus gyrociliatus]
MVRIPIILLMLFAYKVSASELTFELPDNAVQCFHEIIKKGTKATIEYQVVTGGNYDVDLEVKGPGGKILYKEQKKQYDTFNWAADEDGEHVFCFSNEFSTFTHKVVYMDLMVGEEKPLTKGMESHHTALTQMETSAVSVHEALKSIRDFQTHHRLREAQGRVYAEELNEKVQFWSIGESIIVLIVGIGQIIVLKSFFTDKRPTTLST